MKAYLKIEMPKSCASCEWSKLSKMDLGMSCFCTLAKKIGSLEIAKNNRMDFCPLIPVPQHGRLIDADKLVRELNSIRASFGSANGLVEGGLNIAVSTVNGRPTIIPAEEGE